MIINSGKTVVKTGPHIFEVVIRIDAGFLGSAGQCSTKPFKYIFF